MALNLTIQKRISLVDLNAVGTLFSNFNEKIQPRTLHTTWFNAVVNRQTYKCKIIDLPEATIAIQVSGTFGSRQEEAQRLGRILRPKADGRGARFYSLVARDTIDQDFAQNRQRFLAEQGYAYRIIDADEILNKN